MPWHIEKRDDQFCVMKDDDNSTEACHDTRQDAEDHMKALYANEPDAGVEKVAAMKVERRAGRKAGNQWCVVDDHGKLKSCHGSRAEADAAREEYIAHGGAATIQGATLLIEERDNRWCVVLPTGASHCFDSQQEAEDLARSFAEWDEEADEAPDMDDMPMDMPMPTATNQWRGVLAMEGMTDDGRLFEHFDWRELPLTLLCQIATPAMGPHEGAQVCGRIEWIERRGRAILGGGSFNDDEFGQYAMARCQDDSLTGVSIDAVGMGEYRCTEFDTSDPEMPRCADMVLAFAEATICAATQLATPAFAAARIEMVPPEETPDSAESALVRLQADAEKLLPPTPAFPEPPPMQREPDLLDLLLGSTVAVEPGRPTEISPPVEPPREWFEVDEPDHYVPLHITAEGQVLGHIAPWGECHTGFPGACVTAPTSPSSYAFFNLNTVVCADGSTVRTGPLTLTTSHADEHYDVGRTMNHYDNTGCAVADVTVRDGVWGPWVCGAARPTITPQQVREFHASAPSGDWRPLRGKLDLVAVLMVNTPGFPPLVASAVRALEGGRYEQESLILTSVPAGTKVAPSPLEARIATIEARLRRVEVVANAVFDQMEPQLFEALRASIED